MDKTETKGTVFNSKEIKNYFDKTPQEDDSFKKKNEYYYSLLEKPYCSETGKRQFDFVIMADVIDQVYDLTRTFNEIHSTIKPESRILIYSINPLWRPILKIGEKLKMKAPEGLYNGINSNSLKSILYLTDFEIIDKKNIILLPKKIPFFSDLVNSVALSIPLVKNLCLVQSFVIKPKEKIPTKKASFSVIIPAFNEEENLEECIERIPITRATEVVIVNDGSTDNTLKIAQKIAKKKKFVKVVSYDKNEGKGYAVKKGFENASNDVLIILDADMSVPPEELKYFYDAINSGKAEFLNGTRMVYPMETQAMRSLHVIGNKIFGKVFSWILKQTVTDTLCGTKVIHRKDYLKINLIEKSWPDFDLLFGASELNIKIAEVPVHYKRRTGGESKMKTFHHGFLLIKMCFKGIKKLKLGL